MGSAQEAPADGPFDSRDTQVRSEDGQSPMTLISFLGRVPKGHDGYRRTTYRFPDGGTDESAYFGYSLLRRVKPDKFVVLGTSGSMWDHLFAGLGTGDRDDELLELVTSVEDKTVSQDQLRSLEPFLSESLSASTRLSIIPYARTESDQLAIVKSIADEAADSVRLHLDVTHGFRHLPLLALTALEYLRAARPEIEIEKIWYGAFDEDTLDAPVHDLSGLLRILDGATALTRFDTTGDYSSLAPLVSTKAGELLRQAAFLERIHQTESARNNVLTALKQLEDRIDTGLPSLFDELLADRLSWARFGNPYLRQRSAAYLNLEHGDELRATLFGYEAVVTRYIVEKMPGRGVDDRQAREEAARLLTGTQAFRTLNELRNRLAHGHGTRLSDDAVAALRSQATLQQTLRGLFQELIP